MLVTACECEQPGWCPRHKCTKTRHWHQLCRSMPDYFRVWEEGRGPGQTPGLSRPLSRSDCVNRGEEIELRRCTGCRGEVLIRVFACTIHEACAVSAKFEDVKTCGNCSDFASQGGGKNQLSEDAPK